MSSHFPPSLIHGPVSCCLSSTTHLAVETLDQLAAPKFIASLNSHLYNIILVQDQQQGEAEQGF